MALAKLSIGRQANLAAEDLQVYLEDLDDIPADIVADACKNLRRMERLEFESTMPSIGAIVSECKDIPRQRELARLTALAATAPKQLLRGEFVRKDLPKVDAKQFVDELKARVEKARGQS